MRQPVAMRKLLQIFGSLFAYAWALITHWLGWLMSSLLLGVVLNVYERVSGKSIPIRYYVAILLFGVFVASYLAWRRERQDRETAESKLREAENQLARRQPKVVITGRQSSVSLSRAFQAQNLGVEAAFHLAGCVTFPDTNISLELMPVTVPVHHEPVDVLFVGRGLDGFETHSDDTRGVVLTASMAGFVHRKRQGGVEVRIDSFEFDVTYTDFSGRMRYTTPHVLVYVNGEVRIERSTRPEQDPIPIT